MIKKPPLWAGCTVLSLTVHMAALYIALHGTLQKESSSLFIKTKPLAEVKRGDEWKQVEILLAPVFEEIPLVLSETSTLEKSSSYYESPPAQKEPQQEIAPILPKVDLLQEEASKKERQSLSFSFQEQEEDLTNLFAKIPFAYESAFSHAPTSFFSTLELSASPLEEIVDVHHKLPLSFSSKELFSTNTNLPSFEESALIDCKLISSKHPSLQNRSIQEEEQEALSPLLSPPFKEQTGSFPIAKATISSIDSCLQDSVLSSLYWSKNFDMETTVAPTEDGYLFSINLLPKGSLNSQRMKQNIYFLIDISADMEKHKLGVCKRAVLRALSHLQAGDGFNIFLLGKTITKLSTQNLFYSPETLRTAEKFLEEQCERNPFVSLDLYPSLHQIVSSIEDDGEAHTALLLSSGKTSSLSEEKKELQKLLEHNRGKLSLFTAATGQNNHLVHLDMIATLCGGRLLYCDTHASFPRQLTSFVKSLRAPLAKHLQVTLEPTDPSAHIKTSYPSLQAPHLYQGDSFCIVGKIDRLCDLKLFLEGKGEEGNLYLEKVISFEGAKESSYTFRQKKLAFQTAELYQRFLADGKESSLREAHELLQKVHGKAIE